MNELKKKLEDLLEAHTKKMVVSCDENCMCWEIESLLYGLDMQAEKRRPTKRPADGFYCGRKKVVRVKGYPACPECHKPIRRR